MFFFGPKVLLLLKRRSLEIYLKGSEKALEVEFHSSGVRHLEVVDRDEVTKTLVEAFKGANLSKQTAVIALSDHIIFQKLIPQAEPGVAQQAIARFYHDVPLEEAHIAKKIMPLKGSALALAANRELYTLVAEVAREFEWKIKAVIPMTPFAKLAEDAQLSPDQVDQILGSDQIFKEADFLTESLLAPEVVEKSDEEKQAESSGGAIKNIATVLIALFLLSLILGSLVYFKIVTLPFTIPFLSEESLPAVTMAPEASQSAQTALVESTASGNIQEASISAQIDRSEIRIHVLNGSEIAGQANKVKEKLVEKGYENVITGNIESSEASASSITYASDVESPVKEEISELVDSLIGESDKLEDSLSEFDIRVVLGKLDSPIE